MKSFKYLQITILLLVFIFPMKGFAQEKKLIEITSFSVSDTENLSKYDSAKWLAPISETWDGKKKNREMDK